MKRLLTLSLIAVCLTAVPAQAQAKAKRCQVNLDGRTGYNPSEVAHLIQCATQHWTVPGGYPMALCIARRESGLYEFADNPSSSASGVYQIVASTWYAWRFGYFADRANMLDLSTSVWDARSNVMIGIWAMAAYGLSPWGGGC